MAQPLHGPSTHLDTWMRHRRSLCQIDRLAVSQGYKTDALERSEWLWQSQPYFVMRQQAQLPSSIYVIFINWHPFYGLVFPFPLYVPWDFHFVLKSMTVKKYTFPSQSFSTIFHGGLVLCLSIISLLSHGNLRKSLRADFLYDGALASLTTNTEVDAGSP